MTTLDAAAFMVVVLGAAGAAMLSAFLARWLVVPVVVLELLLGIVLGPQVLGVIAPDQFISFMANLGLAMLFFFAGYEIDFAAIRGRPLQLAMLGWACSLVLAYSLSGVLAIAGIVISWLYVGSALSTTAIGTLIPIVSDAGELRTPFGRLLLGAGAVGEFGPILLITLVFSAQSPATSTAILLGFSLLAVLTAVLATRSVGKHWRRLERTMESSSQLSVRLTTVLIFVFAVMAADLGLELLLGGFVAGMIVRVAVGGRSARVYESKLAGLSFGFFVPFFFVASGVKLDVGALFEAPAELLKVPLFLALFFAVRGLPVLLLYRRELPLVRDRAALALLTSTQLPLVVAISTLAIEGDHMTPTTAAALVSAAVLSTAMFPLAGLALRKGAAAGPPAAPLAPAP